MLLRACLLFTVSGLILLPAAPVHAQATAGQDANSVVQASNSVVPATTDVEATMKQMGLAYKEAMQATELAEFKRHVAQFSQLVASVQQYQFTPEKQQFFRQGLAKLQEQSALALAATDLATAQQQFRQVDALRKEYHQERSISIWQLLFGG